MKFEVCYYDSFPATKADALQLTTGNKDKDKNADKNPLYQLCHRKCYGDIDNTNEGLIVGKNANYKELYNDYKAVYIQYLSDGNSALIDEFTQLLVKHAALKDKEYIDNYLKDNKYKLSSYNLRKEIKENIDIALKCIEDIETSQKKVE